ALHQERPELSDVRRGREDPGSLAHLLPGPAGDQHQGAPRLSQGDEGLRPSTRHALRDRGEQRAAGAEEGAVEVRVQGPGRGPGPELREGSHPGRRPCRYSGREAAGGRSPIWIEADWAWYPSASG